MKIEQWGYANPILSPLYSAPPLYWRDTKLVMVLYETTLDRVQAVVPEPMEPGGNRVIAWVSDAPIGSLQGACRESCLYVQVKYKGYTGTYEPFLYTSTDAALSSCREIWGFCKKMANINLRLEKEMAIGEVERVGTKILTIQTTIDEPASYDELPWGSDGSFSLKVIPGAAAHEAPLRELILTPSKASAADGHFFKGRGSISFEHSDLDPLDILRPERVIAGYYGLMELYVPYGKVIYRY